jgi:hypothetical protein
LQSMAVPYDGRFSEAWIAFAFVLSRYAGAHVENHRHHGTVPSGADASASRAASTPMEVVSSSKLATDRVPRPPPEPNDDVIADRCSLQ